MKKTRTLMLAVALGTGICAFALPSGIADCTFSPQYALINGNYVPAGVFGHDYLCEDAEGICTYVLSAGQFVPCRVGGYLSAKVSK